MVYLSLRPHSISHIYLERESFFCFFFFLLHTPSFSLGFLMFVSFHQSSSDAFMQTHSPLFSQCLSLSAASTLIQYGLQALDTAQLPDSDEHILISYKSSPHREEALQIKKKTEKDKANGKAWEDDTKRTKCSANMTTSFRSTLNLACSAGAFQSQQDSARKHNETFRLIFNHRELLEPGT